MVDLSPARDILEDRTFLVVVTTSMLGVAGVSLLSPALPALAGGMQVGEGDIGLLITAFTLPSLFVLPVSGYLADRFGRNAVMAAGSVLIGVGGLLSFAYPAFQSVVAFRVLQGIGYAGVMPMTVALIGDLYSDREETTAQGLRTSFNKVAGIGWMVAGGIIAAVGWQYIFLLYTAFLPLAVLLYIAVPEQTPTDASVTTYFDELATVVKEPKIALYLSIGFIRFFLKYGMLTFLPLLLSKRYGMTSSTIGVYMAIIGGAGIVSAAMAGTIDARYRKTSSVFTALLLVGTAYTVIGVTYSVLLTVAMLVVVGVADAAMSPLHKSLLTHNVDREHRGGIIAANALGQNLGKTVAPVALGLLTVFGYTTLFLAAGFLAIFSVVNYLYLRNLLAARNLYP